MLRYDGGCAICMYLREPRQYLLVNYFRLRVTWLPPEIHNYFISINVIPIDYILYLPRIMNKKHFYSLFHITYLIETFLLIICSNKE